MAAATHKKTVPTISDAKEARIQAGIANDPDNPEISAAEFEKMKPASEVLPPALYAALVTRPRGRPKAAVTKQEIKLRLDPDIVSAFKATGAKWQTRINDVLSKAAKTIRKESDARPAIAAKATRKPTKPLAKKPRRKVSSG